MRLPGTVLSEEVFSAKEAEARLAPLFFDGTLTLSQVAHLSGLPAYVIQNWMRRGFLPGSEQRGYTRRQVSRILLINMLRKVMRLEEICQLISHVNGRLDDISDDLIDDSNLYLALVECMLALQDCAQPEESRLNAVCDQALQGYCEPEPGALQTVKEGLQVLVLGAMAGELCRRTEVLFLKIKGGENGD